MIGTPAAFLATNNFDIDPSGSGRTASRISVPIVVAYQSCPAWLIPQSLSSQTVTYFVSVVSVVQEEPSEE